MPASSSFFFDMVSGNFALELGSYILLSLVLLCCCFVMLLFLLELKKRKWTIYLIVVYLFLALQIVSETFYMISEGVFLFSLFFGGMLSIMATLLFLAMLFSDKSNKFLFFSVFIIGVLIISISFASISIGVRTLAAILRYLLSIVLSLFVVTFIINSSRNEK